MHSPLHVVDVDVPRLELTADGLHTDLSTSSLLSGAGSCRSTALAPCFATLNLMPFDSGASFMGTS